MTEEQQFCLRWNDFQTNMVASFKHLRDEKSFCDVTIATEVNSCSYLIEILRTLESPWIKGLGASLDLLSSNPPGPTHQSPQDDPMRLLPLLQEPAGSEPRQAPHHHLEGCWGFVWGFKSTDAFFPGCTICSFECYPGVHVCRRGKSSCSLMKLPISFFFSRNEYHVHNIMQPGERGSGTAACFPENCWEAQDQGFGRRHTRSWLVTSI